MNRVIKFRAWDKKNNEMIDSNRNIRADYDEFWGDKFAFQLGSIEDINGDDRFKIMQFTGLQDKNSKDIYEGDIVKVNARYDKAEGEVVFHECAWCFIVPVESKHEDPYRNIGTGWYGIEVIGNIFESPELLKAK